MSNAAFDFSGHDVFVSGGTRGIGAAIAVAFADAGAAVTVLGKFDRGERPGEVLSGRSKKARYPVAALDCDVTDTEAIARTVAGLGEIDVFVNNAGVEKYTPLAGSASEYGRAAAETAGVNFTGALIMTQAVVPHMKRGGSIIFTASIWSKTAVREFSAYCASKHATLGMMRSFARELGPAGIRVNAVCPGWVRTDASMRSLAEMARTEGRKEEELLAEITGAQCFGGLLEPEALAGAYLFLASGLASDITGQSITVDRGETCL